MFPASSETKLCAGKVEVLSNKSLWNVRHVLYQQIAVWLPWSFTSEEPIRSIQFTTNPTTRRLSIDQESHHELEIIIRVAADANKQSCGDF
jgi:hypothetical protein